MICSGLLRFWGVSSNLNLEEIPPQTTLLLLLYYYYYYHFITLLVMIVDTAIICILMGPFHTDYKVWGWMYNRSNGSDECVPQMCV